jgi:hypothetical protein
MRRRSASWRPATAGIFWPALDRTRGCASHFAPSITVRVATVHRSHRWEHQPRNEAVWTRASVKADVNVSQSSAPPATLSRAVETERRSLESSGTMISRPRRTRQTHDLARRRLADVGMTDLGGRATIWLLRDPRRWSILNPGGGRKRPRFSQIRDVCWGSRSPRHV